MNVIDADSLEQQKALLQGKATLEGLINKERKKYFHLNTLGNFITHFNKISNVDDRQWVFRTLHNYINEALGLNQQMNIDVSKTIYEEYLNKVAKYYDEHLGFRMYVYLWVITLMYLIALIIVAYVTNIYIGLAALSVLFIYHMTFLYRKHKQKKLFGTFY